MQTHDGNHGRPNAVPRVRPHFQQNRHYEFVQKQNHDQVPRGLSKNRAEERFTPGPEPVAKAAQVAQAIQ